MGCVCVYICLQTHCMNLYPLSSGTFTMSPSLLHLHYCTIPPTYYFPYLGYSCLCDKISTTNEPMQSLWVGQGERGDKTGRKGISEKHGKWFSSCRLKVWLSFYFVLTILPFCPRTRPSLILVSTWTGRSNGLRILKSWKFCLPSNPVHESPRCNQTFNACGHMCYHTFNNYDLIDYLGWWYLWWQKKTCYGIL